MKISKKEELFKDPVRFIFYEIVSKSEELISFQEYVITTDFSIDNTYSYEVAKCNDDEAIVLSGLEQIIKQFARGDHPRKASPIIDHLFKVGKRDIIIQHVLSKIVSSNFDEKTCYAMINAMILLYDKCQKIERKNCSNGYCYVELVRREALQKLLCLVYLSKDSNLDFTLIVSALSKIVICFGDRVKKNGRAIFGNLFSVLAPKYGYCPIHPIDKEPNIIPLSTNYTSADEILAAYMLPWLGQELKDNTRNLLWLFALKGCLEFKAPIQATLEALSQYRASCEKNSITRSIMDSV